MARHLRDLGCADTRRYVAFCRANGFPSGLNKSTEARACELAAHEAAQNAQRLQKRRVRKLLGEPASFIEAACRERLPEGLNLSDAWTRVAAQIADAPKARGDRERLAQFLTCVNARSDLVFASLRSDRHETPVIDALLRLHRKRGLWLRAPEDWTPDSHNQARRLSSLIRHLLAEYPTPAFLESAWLRADREAARYRDLYIHLGAGRSARNAPTPYPMTRKTLHAFLGAPHHQPIEAALIHADVEVLGGDRRLAEALCGTRLGREVECDPKRRDFWLSVYRFFIDNPMLDRRHIGPIVDYLAHQKFEPCFVYLGGRVVRVLPPAQPNLTMARRNPEALLRQVDRWHAELSDLRSAARHSWTASPYSGMQLTTGPADTPERQVRWSLREIVTSGELFDEGRRMRHCVASYLASCSAGHVSIWSLKRQGHLAAEPTRSLTVSVMSGKVSEARGLANRLPTEQEWSVLRRWMRREGLKPAPFLAGWE